MQKLILFFSLFSLLLLNACAAQPNLRSSEAEAEKNQRERQKDIATILETAGQYICNPAWLESPEWKQFVTEIQSEEMLALPSLEFASAFNQKRKKLPFTHFYLKSAIANKKSADQSSLPHFELKPVDEKTALLTIRSFVADAPGMIKIVKQIQAGGYEKLVIDLRGNTGGTLDAAVVLGRFLTQKPIDAGVYLTRKWFMNHEGYPNAEDIQNMPFLQDMTYEGIMKAYAENEAIRMVLPPHSNPTFQGKVAVLTDNITGSTCEPLVDRLKKIGRATIVGRKTAGGMLSGKYFKISDELKLFLPIADYMTAEGTRIDKVGVDPDVDVNSEQALEYALTNVL